MRPTRTTPARLAALAAALVVIGFVSTDAVVAQEAPFDNIERAEAVPSPTDGTTIVSRSLANATLQPGETAPCGDIGGTIWFEFDVPREASIAIDASGTDFPVILAAYTLTGFLPSPPGGSLANVACDVSSDTEPARLTFTAQQGERYFIQAGGAEDAEGDVQLTFGCDPGCPPPNDDIAFAKQVFALPEFSEFVDTTLATLEPDEAQPCGDIGATVWYAISLPGVVASAGTLRVSAQGDGVDTVVAVYAQRGFIPSPPGGIELIACADDGPGGIIEASVEVPTEPGVAYYAQVGGKAGVGGRLAVQIFCGGCPVADQGPVTGTGGGQGGGDVPPPSGIGPPDTGSGGYR